MYEVSVPLCRLGGRQPEARRGTCARPCGCCSCPPWPRRVPPRRRRAPGVVAGAGAPRCSPPGGCGCAVGAGKKARRGFVAKLRCPQAQGACRTSSNMPVARCAYDAQEIAAGTTTRGVADHHSCRSLSGFSVAPALIPCAFRSGLVTGRPFLEEEVVMLLSRNE